MEESSTPLYELQHVEKTVFDGSKDRTILQIKELRIEEHEFYGIVGESGAGKTTLLHILGGIETISKGTVKLRGKPQPLSENGRWNAHKLVEFRRQIGFVFQSLNLFDDFSVYENVAQPLRLTNTPEAKIAQQVKQALADVNFSHDPATPVNKLSGGERQRISIARAIVGERRIILADEPTGNLDSDNERNILDLLETLRGKRNLSILLVTHSERVKERFTKIIVIDDGQVAYHGPSTTARQHTQGQQVIPALAEPVPPSSDFTVDAHSFLSDPPPLSSQDAPDSGTPLLTAPTDAGSQPLSSQDDSPRKATSPAVQLTNTGQAWGRLTFGKYEIYLEGLVISLGTGEINDIRVQAEQWFSDNKGVKETPNGVTLFVDRKRLPAIHETHLILYRGDKEREPWVEHSDGMPQHQTKIKQKIILSSSAPLADNSVIELVGQDKSLRFTYHHIQP